MKDGQAILDALPSSTDQNDAIHAARKAIRRMRALLALLVDDGIDLQREDVSLKRLAKGLSDMRDAHVVVETCRRLQTAHPGTDWAPVIAALERRRTLILQKSLAEDPAFERRRRVLERILECIEDQPWSALRRAPIRKALERSERRVTKAAARARQDADPEQVHRWRRRVRRLRMQLDAAHLLGALHGHDALAKEARSLHRISDRLGWLQDLQLLRNLVRNMPAGGSKAAVLDHIDSELQAATR